MDNKHTQNFLYGVHAIKLEDYLKKAGIKPIREVLDQVLFESPFGGGKDKPLIVMRYNNSFNDPHSGFAGRIMEFGQFYHNFSAAQFLTHLNENYPVPKGQLSHPALMNEHELYSAKILSDQRRIDNPVLLEHLKKIRVPLETAERYCQQVRFKHYGEEFDGVGMKNDSGGYALFLEKGRVFNGPMDVTTIGSKSDKVDLFFRAEDFLNVSKLRPSKLFQDNDKIILHNYTMFEKIRPKLESYDRVNLYLENSHIGKEISAYAQWLDKAKYRDFSPTYSSHLNITEKYMEIEKKVRLNPGKKL